MNNHHLEQPGSTARYSYLKCSSQFARILLLLVFTGILIGVSSTLIFNTVPEQSLQSAEGSRTTDIRAEGLWQTFKRFLRFALLIPTAILINYFLAAWRPFFYFLIDESNVHHKRLKLLEERLKHLPVTGGLFRIIDRLFDLATRPLLKLLELSARKVGITYRKRFIPEPP